MADCGETVEYERAPRRLPPVRRVDSNKLQPSAPPVSEVEKEQSAVPAAITEDQETVNGSDNADKTLGGDQPTADDTVVGQGQESDVKALEVPAQAPIGKVRSHGSRTVSLLLPGVEKGSEEEEFPTMTTIGGISQPDHREFLDERALPEPISELTSPDPMSERSDDMKIADHIADRIAERALAHLEEVLPELCSRQSNLLIEKLQGMLQSSQLVQAPAPLQTLGRRQSFRRRKSEITFRPCSEGGLLSASSSTGRLGLKELAEHGNHANSMKSAMMNVTASIKSDEADLAGSDYGSVGTASVDTGDSELQKEEADRQDKKAAKKQAKRSKSASSFRRMDSSISKMSRTSFRTKGEFARTDSWNQSERSKAGSDAEKENGGDWNVKELEFNLMNTYLEGVVGMPHGTLKRAQSTTSRSEGQLGSRTLSSFSSGLKSGMKSLSNWWRNGASSSSSKVGSKGSAWDDVAHNLAGCSSMEVEPDWDACNQERNEYVEQSPRKPSLKRAYSHKSEKSVASIESGRTIVSALSRASKARSRWSREDRDDHNLDTPPKSPRGTKAKTAEDDLSSRKSGVMELIAEQASHIAAGAVDFSVAESEREKETEPDSPQVTLGGSECEPELAVNRRSSEPYGNSHEEANHTSESSQKGYHSEGPSRTIEQPVRSPERRRTAPSPGMLQSAQQARELGPKSDYTTFRCSFHEAPAPISRTYSNGSLLQQGPLVTSMLSHTPSLIPGPHAPHANEDPLDAISQARDGLSRASSSVEKVTNGGLSRASSSVDQAQRLSANGRPGPLQKKVTLSNMQETSFGPSKSTVSHATHVWDGSQGGFGFGSVRTMNSLAPMTTSSQLRHWRTSQIVHCVDSTETNFSTLSSALSNGALSSNDDDSDDARQEGGFDDATSGTQRKPPFALQFTGIMPWRETGLRRIFPCVYQWIVLLLATSALGACMEQTIRTRMKVVAGSLCYSHACLKLGLLSDIPLACGCLAGLLSLGVHRNSKALVQCIQMLSCYAARSGFNEKWARLAKKDLIFVCVIWTCSALERARGSGLIEAIVEGRLVEPLGVFQVVSFAFFSGLLLALTFCVLYVCRALMTMIDTYCIDMIQSVDLNQAVAKWNIIQAFLRQSSFTIEFCFFVLQTTALSCCVLGVADVVLLMRKGDGGLTTLIPGTLVTLGIARIFFSAASVTDECAHVPSLVNSLSFGQEEMDLERQYVVNYIIHSAAGFYVFEVRLTSAMSLKFAYFCAVAGFTLTTTILSDVSL